MEHELQNCFGHLIISFQLTYNPSLCIYSIATAVRKGRLPDETPLLQCYHVIEGVCHSGLINRTATKYNKVVSHSRKKTLLTCTITPFRRRLTKHSNSFYHWLGDLPDSGRPNRQTLSEGSLLIDIVYNNTYNIGKERGPTGS